MTTNPKPEQKTETSTEELVKIYRERAKKPQGAVSVAIAEIYTVSANCLEALEKDNKELIQQIVDESAVSYGYLDRLKAQEKRNEFMEQWVKDKNRKILAQEQELKEFKEYDDLLDETSSVYSQWKSSQKELTTAYQQIKELEEEEPHNEQDMAMIRTISAQLTTYKDTLAAFVEIYERHQKR